MKNEIKFNHECPHWLLVILIRMPDVMTTEKNSTNRETFFDSKRTLAYGSLRTYWRCVVKDCKARINLKNNTITSTTPLHTHPEQRAEIMVHKVKVSIRQRSAPSMETTNHIVAATLANPSG